MRDFRDFFQSPRGSFGSFIPGPEADFMLHVVEALLAQSCVSLASLSATMADISDGACKICHDSDNEFEGAKISLLCSCVFHTECMDNYQNILEQRYAEGSLRCPRCRISNNKSMTGKSQIMKFRRML